MTGALTPQRISLPALSALDQASFARRLGAVFEHSDWIAERAWPARPFPTLEALHAALARVVRQAGPEAALTLLRQHPELAAAGKLTEASRGEQASAGLQSLDAAAAEAFARANRQYRERFGFPFIVAVRGERDAATILAALRQRLGNPPEAEREAALLEVLKIARYRLEDLVEPARVLTTHVLDVARGLPAAGLGLTLSRDGTRLVSAVTNADGRCDAPLLADADLLPGTYELVFDVGTWRKAEAWRGGEPDHGFYDLITVRFLIGPGCGPGCGHVHVPLLLSPYGYSTYRGS